MQTLQTQEVKETTLLLQNFQVEELEERLENKWVADCTTECYHNGCTTTYVTNCH